MVKKMQSRHYDVSQHVYTVYDGDACLSSWISENTFKLRPMKFYPSTPSSFRDIEILTVLTNQSDPWKTTFYQLQFTIYN